MEYQLTKFIHVLLAIIAVGFNASYGIWLARAARAPQATQSHVLRTIKLLDDRFANPAYVLLLVTGLFMVFNAGIPLSRFWIAGAIRVLEAEGPDSAEYQRLSARGRNVGIVLAIIVVFIVFLMVTKPA